MGTAGTHVSGVPIVAYIAVLATPPTPPPQAYSRGLTLAVDAGLGSGIVVGAGTTLTWTAPAGETPLSYTVVWWLNQTATPPHEPNGATDYTIVSNITQTSYEIESGGSPGDTLYAQIFAVYVSGTSVPTAVVSTTI